MGAQRSVKEEAGAQPRHQRLKPGVDDQRVAQQDPEELIAHDFAERRRRFGIRAR